MRTTLSISDELLEAAKRRARETGQSLGAVVDAALRREFALPTQSPDRPPVPIFTGGTGPRPGVDLSSNAALFVALDEGVPLEQRR